MKWLTLVIFAAVTAAASAQTTRPASQWYEELKLVYAMPVPMDSQPDLKSVTGMVHWESLRFNPPEIVARTENWAVVRLRSKGEVTAPEGIAATKRFKDLFNSTVPLDQRRQQYAELDKKVHQAATELRTLDTLHQGYAKLRDTDIADQLKASQSTISRLEMDLAAKEARGNAIRIQIERIGKQTADKIKDDLILTQLKKVVELRKAAVQQAQEAHRAGVGGSEELGKAETALAEAQIRLAEREEALRQSNKGDLLSRLTDELAMLMIDQAEIASKIEYLKATSLPTDLEKITEKDLQEMAADKQKLLSPPSMPPIWGELNKRLDELTTQMVRVLVCEVRELTDAEQEALPAQIQSYKSWQPRR